MSTDNISNVKLKLAYYIAAKYVTEFGDAYLPIFERLELEYKERQDKKEALKRAKQIALKISN